MARDFAAIRRSALLLCIATVGFAGGGLVRGVGTVTSTAAPRAALALDATTPLVAGPPDADVVVRIFGDYGCPACQALHRALGDTLLALARRGRLRLVYLQRPLGASTTGHALALAVACAPAERAWDVHDGLFASRADGIRAGAPRLPLDPDASAALRRCAASDAVRRRVRAAIDAAVSAGFHEVPVVLVGDQRVHFRTYPALLRHVTRMLE